MSCSYGLIPLTNLLSNGSKSILLQGGEPDKIVKINPDDIRTNRTGFSLLKKAFSS